MSKTNVEVRKLNMQTNSFTIIKVVVESLTADGYDDLAKEFVTHCLEAKNNGELLEISSEYVHVA